MLGHVIWNPFLILIIVLVYIVDQVVLWAE